MVMDFSLYALLHLVEATQMSPKDSVTGARNGRPTGIRTQTVRILSPLSLPVGVWAPAHVFIASLHIVQSGIDGLCMAVAEQKFLKAM